MTASTPQENTALTVVQPSAYDLSPRNFEEAWRMAEYLADSEMVPKDFQRKPANCLIAIQWGAELGIKTMQAIQNIAVINGRPSLWGDVMLALVRNSSLCEYVTEEVSDERAVCRVKRRGEPEQTREFTKADAEKAGLWTKTGPWQQYKKRMLQMRARAWALRDVFTDVLKGLSMAEEALDMPPPEKFMGPADVVGAPPPPAPTEWPADLFAQRLPEWHKAIRDKKATADQVVAKARTKYPLSAEQEKAIRTVPKTDATDVAPKVKAADVEKQMREAKDEDALNVAAALISAVEDAQLRKGLEAIYDELLAAIKEGTTK